MAASTSSAVLARRGLAIPVAVGCCAMGAVVYVAAVDPSTGGTYPGCVVRSVTGWWCPGCGLTRATHHLLHGDIGQAFGYNALAVPILVMLMMAWVTWLIDCRGQRPAWMHNATVPAWIGLGAVALAFTIVRNVPSFDLPRG